jgi:tetratricopeptide (TPR) repeat protein
MKAGKKSFDKSDFDGAKLAYNNALGVFPDNTEAQAGLKSVDDAIAAASNAESAEAEAERLAKEKADAEEAEKNAAKEFENRQKLYKNFMKTGASNLEEAEYVQALKNFKNALSLDIDNEEAQKAVNEAESALRAFEKQNEAKSFENKYKNHISDGVLALKRNEFEDAIDAFNKALEMKPTDKTALEGLKRVEEQRIEFEAAEAERLKREARAAKLKQEEFQKAFDAVVAQGDALVEGEKFAPAVVKYDQALKMQDDAGVREKLEEARKGLQRLKDLAEQKSKDAADALAANRPREREQLAEIIEEESDKSRVVSPTGGTSSRPQVRVAQGVLGEDDSRPSTITTAVAVIGKVRSGEAARKSSPAGKMSEEDKYDSQLAIIDRQQSELKATEEQKELQLKYPKRKTIETQEVGNSIVTLIYMNIDNRVTVYKKVEHSWGGVFYFVDDRSTNQRFWEFQTK